MLYLHDIQVGMNKKRSIGGGAAVIIILLGVTMSRNTSKNRPEEPTSGLNRKASHLVYTKHARCRMDCRKIDESEVREILEKGTLNYAKSAPADKPCPTYALEGTTHDQQRVRIVFAGCSNDELKVVTCIDLDTDWQCACN